jgi:hypothetical protein
MFYSLIGLSRLLAVVMKDMKKLRMFAIASQLMKAYFGYVMTTPAPQLLEN